MTNVLFEQFEEYCKTPGIESGKATSYAKAIQYLCDYLNISIIDENAIEELKNIENDISDKNSLIYEELNNFLERRNQKSYLSKGYIRAALKYFYNFVNDIHR